MASWHYDQMPLMIMSDLKCHLIYFIVIQQILLTPALQADSLLSELPGKIGE